MRIFLITIIILAGIIGLFFPKPYGHVGGVAGYELNPSARCFGFRGFMGEDDSRGECLADCMATVVCYGIPYRQ